MATIVNKAGLILVVFLLVWGCGAPKRYTYRKKDGYMPWYTTNLNLSNNQPKQNKVSKNTLGEVRKSNGTVPAPTSISRQPVSATIQPVRQNLSPVVPQSFNAAFSSPKSSEYKLYYLPWHNNSGSAYTGNQDFLKKDFYPDFASPSQGSVNRLSTKGNIPLTEDALKKQKKENIDTTLVERVSESRNNYLPWHNNKGSSFKGNKVFWDENGAR
jgi:hypothetical protein